MNIDAQGMHFQQLNKMVKESAQDIIIDNCEGQRFIAAGLSGKNITINGTPGNALGAYLDGAEVVVRGNVQDAVGDTMNNGNIIVYGNAGDALGYAMRGGKIYIKGNSGYRTGIHMKEYGEKQPVIIVGGAAGSFLGEYLAGGTIIVLGLDIDKDEPIVGNFTGTGMHGGSIYIRADRLPKNLPSQVSARQADENAMRQISEHLKEYSLKFNLDYDSIMQDKFYILKPNAKSPYKKMYTAS